MNIVVQSVPVPTFRGFGYIIPEVKLLDHMESLFNCLRNYHTVFLNHTFSNSDFYGMWIIPQFFFNFKQFRGSSLKCPIRQLVWAL